MAEEKTTKATSGNTVARRGLRWSVNFFEGSFSPKNHKASHAAAGKRGKAEGHRVGGFFSNRRGCGSICKPELGPRRDGLCRGPFVVDNRLQPNRRSEP